LPILFSFALIRSWGRSKKIWRDWSRCYLTGWKRKYHKDRSVTGKYGDRSRSKYKMQNKIIIYWLLINPLKMWQSLNIWN